MVQPEFSNVRTKRKRRKNYFSGELNASRMTILVSVRLTFYCFIVALRDSFKYI